MIDLYQSLGISEQTSVAGIRSAIEVARLTLDEETQATSDSAEVRNRRSALDLAERVLLDENRRQDYERARRLARTLEHTNSASGKVLAERGWSLTSKDNTEAEAIVLAERAVKVDPSNVRAWGLLGYASHKWGNPHEALPAIKRAIQLDPTDSAAHAVLAEILKTLERYVDAITAYERCFELDPDARDPFGPGYWTCLLGTGQIDKAIEFLEEQRRSKPEEAEIQNALAFAYSESAYAGWTRVEEGDELLAPGYYATSLDHVTAAQQALMKALSLNFADAEVAAALNSVKQDIDRMTKRKFVGNWMAAAIAGVIGLLMIGDKTMLTHSVYLLVGSGLYIGSSFIPQYIINQHLVRGKRFSDFEWLARLSDWAKQFDNLLIKGILLAFVFAVGALAVPLFGLYNLYRYHGDDIRLWLTSSRNKEKVSGLMAKLQATTRATTQAASGALGGIKAKVQELRRAEPRSTDADSAPRAGVSVPDRGRSGSARAGMAADAPVSTQAPTSMAAATIPPQRSAAKPVDPVPLATSRHRTWSPSVVLAVAIAVVLGMGGAGYWAWIEKEKADALARQMEERRIAEAQRMEEEAARREQERQQKLKQEEDRRQKAEQDRLAAEARAAEEAQVRRQAEARAAEEASARRQAQATASAAARAQEDARRAAQAAEQRARAAVPPSTRAVGYEAASAAVRRSDYRAAYNACLAPAQAGDARCQNMMGLLYVNGQVGSRTPTDLRVAAEWFRRAAQQNVAPSQFNLALMYERGAGLPQDLNAARMWYARAAAQGHANAAQALARLGK